MGEREGRHQESHTLLIARYLLCIVHCPGGQSHMMVKDRGVTRMRQYLGVSAVCKKGRIKHWCAQMYGKELGKRRTPEAAAEIVRRMAGAKSIK